MSPRAASRLEILGFAAVYDYVGGKADWLAAGLRTEGPGSTTPRPGALARRDVRTCGTTDTVGTARTRIAAGSEDRCVVLAADRTVLGEVDHDRLTNDDDRQAGSVMRPGPTTVRADEDLAPLLARMHDHDVTSILVTDPEGRLIGVLHRDDGDQAISADSRG